MQTVDYISRDKSTEKCFDWNLKDENGRPVCNFYPKVLGIVKMISTNGKNEHIRLQLIFKDCESSEITLLLSELEHITWSDYDKRCILSPHYQNANRYIAAVIRSCLNKVGTEVRYKPEKLGVCHLEGETVFIAGDRVIIRSSAEIRETSFDLRQATAKLDIDEKVTKEQAFEGMKNLICLSPEIGRVLVAHAVSGLIRSAFKEVGFTPCAVLVIMGKSGMFKSHYVPLLTQLYNRADEIRADTRFNSTTRFIEDILYEHSECTTVIDDLHSAGSKSIKRANETTAEEIIRRISDDTGRGHKEGNAVVQRKFRGNVVFIGEYSIGQGSTMPRALIASLTQKIDGAVLDQYQRHQPLLVSTFYYYFLCWYVEYFEDICKGIDEKLTKFRKETTNSCLHGRLRDTQFYLQTSYMIFLEFCRDSDFISDENALEEYSHFEIQLFRLIQEQQKRYSTDANEMEGMDYIRLIRKLYQRKKFRLADSAESFRPDKHDGLIYYGCLCVRREKLEKRLCKISTDIKIEDVIKALIAKNALRTGAEKRTIKISKLNKNVGALRFYAIKLDFLKK